MIELTFLKDIDIIDIIDINKTSVSKECDICHFWYFNFQPNACNGCQDALMMSVNLNDIAILNINGADYCLLLTGFAKVML